MPLLRQGTIEYTGGKPSTNVGVYFDVGAKQQKVNKQDRFLSLTQGFGLDPS